MKSSRIIFVCLIAQAVWAVEQVSQYGITWTFSSDVEAGQYVNGDWWVTGPVQVVAIENSFHEFEEGLDGSMLNPGTDDLHGYDNRLGNYREDLNVGLPLMLEAGSALISSASWRVGEPGCPKLNGGTGTPRPATRSMAVLTCVKTAPPAGSFRPAYCDRDKSPEFNVSQLDPSRLPALAPVAHTPDLAVVEDHFEGPWVDHVHEWMGGFTHPSEHMEQYGQYLSQQIGEGALMLLLDFKQLPGTPAKDRLLMRFVQLGIDLAGIADAGGGWPSNGGHNMGRKWPILFAGLMLDDDHMKNVGQWSTDFQEDLDTFFVSQADVDVSHSALWSPDKRAEALWPYQAEHIGLPEWGIRHVAHPEQDNLHWSAKYRRINYSAYPGWVLAVLLMDQREAWNHKPLFDYVDRSIAIENPYYPAGTKRANNVFGGRFIQEMWDAYRGTVSPRWVPNDPSDLYSPGGHAE